MASRLIFLLSCIFQYFLLIYGQTAISQTPVESCVPQTVALNCPTGSVAIVRSAYYGIGQTTNLCKYTQGDCISDAMNIVFCTSDTIKCSVATTRKKLSECQDQTATYIRFEYDCVPSDMTASTSLYNICQNDTAIATSSGIIRSPGYPAPFQTTKTECFLTLTAPQDKTIRLWLTDLYIGSTSLNCARDHVIVVDDIQIYRQCGLKRYAYPYLCSSSIVIQYKANTSSTIYRGMRMYFEFADRSSNDGCPAFNGTVTPELGTTTITTTTDLSATTTTPPPYVQLGIASSIRNFQIYKGK